jgi:chemotaxis protein methyltransferase CheR
LNRTDAARGAGRSPRSTAPILDDTTFYRLRERITASSGIYVLTDASSRFILERRLAPRLRVKGAVSFAEYERSLDDAEIDAILDAVAVHETYFFREKRQLKIFSERIAPELRRSQQPVAIWSAGCSTGEEAYTIAMLLGEQGGLRRVRVLASDLSRRVVDVAERGEYTASSFRVTDPTIRLKYFSEISGGRWRVDASLRAAVSFEQSNLVALARQRARGELPLTAVFDVFFCKNVLMYFDDSAVRRSLRLFYSLLKPGGYLLLGHAEGLLPVGGEFLPMDIGAALAHRKV